MLNIKYTIKQIKQKTEDEIEVKDIEPNVKLMRRFSSEHVNYQISYIMFSYYFMKFVFK